DEKDAHLSLIEEPGAQLLLADRLAIEHALDIEIVDAEARIVGDRRARVARARLVDVALEDEVAVMVGEEELLAVNPRDSPAGGERRDRPGEMGRKRRGHGLHGRA